MSKRFNIHDWQAKQRLAEQDNIKSQESMSNVDIKALQTVIGEYSLNKVLNTIAAIVDRIGKHDEADMVEKLANQIQDFDPSDDMDEANTTGTGTSFTAGSSGTGPFATPFAFKKKNKKDIEVLGYKKVNEEEEEEKLSKDVKALEKILSDKINTKDEWIDMFQLLMTHSEEISGLNDSSIRSLLQQSMKEL